MGQPAGLSRWLGVLRWLAPVTAAAVITLLVVRRAPPPVSRPIKPPRAAQRETPPRPAPKTAADVALRADEVQLAQKLVSSYDAVAQLPTGELVRFRVEKWRDQIVLQDTNRGVIVAQTMPRVEVVPVRFETY